MCLSWEFSSCGFAIVGLLLLIYQLKLRLFPLPVESLGSWDVDAQGAVDRAVRGGQPVGFLVRTGRILADVNRERPVVRIPERVQHGRVQQVTLEGIGHEELRLAVIHRERPEGVGGRKLSFLEAQLVAIRVRIRRETTQVSCGVATPRAWPIWLIGALNSELPLSIACLQSVLYVSTNGKP